MPKKIEDLNNKIFNTAFLLFAEKGYESIDMKGIAKSCDIAVGTLYNYYGNKKDIFIKVLNASWNETLEKLKSMSSQNVDKENKKRALLSILYYDIKSRRGLGASFMYTSIELMESIDDITIKIIEVLGKDGNQRDEKDFEKTIKLLLCNIVILINKYPDEDEENINLLMGMVK